MIIYEVLGNPVPWAAPGRKGKVYFNPKHKEKEQAVWQLKSQCNHDPLSCPLHVDFYFYLPIPKSTSAIRKKCMLNGTIQPIGKPDRSNCLKFYEDCLQAAMIISNDSIIVAGKAQKQYGIIPKTTIIIIPLRTQEDYENCP